MQTQTQNKSENLIPFIETEENSATQCGYSDKHAYEIIRRCTPKKIIVRKLHAEMDRNWKPECVLGGFLGHTVNNHSQKWNLFHNPNNKEIAIRLDKRGNWKSADGSRFAIGYAKEFYDYNF